MSKVIIITNHSMDESYDKDGKVQPMEASLFCNAKKYIGKFDNARKVYSKVLMNRFVCKANNSKDAIRLLGLTETESDLPTLLEFAKKLLGIYDKYKENNKDYPDEIEYISQDIEGKSLDELYGDIYRALKNSNKNEEIYNVFADRVLPLCYCKEEGEYKVIGISCFPKDSNAGPAYSAQWVDGLIEDFTNKGDEVILALHGASDWPEKDPKREPVPKYSDEISKSKGRRIKVFLFQHSDMDCIGRALISVDTSLEKIWNNIESVWKQKTEKIKAE